MGAGGSASHLVLAGGAWLPRDAGLLAGGCGVEGKLLLFQSCAGASNTHQTTGDKQEVPREGPCQNPSHCQRVSCLGPVTNKSREAVTEDVKLAEPCQAVKGPGCSGPLCSPHLGTSLVAGTIGSPVPGRGAAGVAAYRSLTRAVRSMVLSCGD